MEGVIREMQLDHTWGLGDSRFLWMGKRKFFLVLWIRLGLRIERRSLIGGLGNQVEGVNRKM